MAAKQIRAPLFVFLSVLSVLQIGASIWSACALSGATGTVKNTAWSRVTVDESGVELDMWLGLTHVVTSRKTSGGAVSNAEATQNWDDFCSCNYGTTEQQSSDCVVTNPSNSTSTTTLSDCQACQDASASFHVAVITGILSKFGQLTTDLTRSKASEDVPCQKIFGIFTGFLGSIATLSTLVVYGQACVQSIPTEVTLDINSTETTISLDNRAGVGFTLILICTVLGFPDSFAHMLVPCPEECAEPGYLEKRAEAAKAATVSP